jgi:hypothetical protein
LVTLGIALLILFALHVIRRSAVRVTALSILLVLFIGGAVAAEAMNYNDNFQAVLFPPSTQLIATLKNAARRAVAYIRPNANTGSSSLIAFASSSAANVQSSARMTASSSAIVAAISSSAATARSSLIAMMLQSSSSLAAASSSKMMAQSSSVAIAASSTAMMSSSTAKSSSSSAPVIAGTVPPPRPGHLPNSGPESFAVLLATLVGLYSGILHIRARKRMDIM